MKAALLEDFSGEWKVDDVDIAEPQDDEVLIEVRASGLCHSDLLTATVDRGLPLPILCGHEVAGVVRRVGPKVRTLAAGDSVTTCVAGACEVCALCVSGRPWLCAAQAEAAGTLSRSSDQPPRLRFDGRTVTQLASIGGFAEQALVPERAVVKIDADVPFDVASILGCAVATGLGAALNSATIKPGDYVAVIGCGGVGLNVIQGARLRGAGRIVAIDLSPGKLKRAEEFGATDTLNAGDGPIPEQLFGLVGRGMDHVFEVAGVESTVRDAWAILGLGGSAYLIGAAPKLIPLSFISAQELLGGAKSIVGVYAGSSRFKNDIPRYVELYRNGLIQLDPLISERISLSDITTTYRAHDSSDAARAVIEF